MLNSTILDVVIALIFTFLAISLAAGTAVEAIASLFKLRSRTLKSGVMDLLNDEKFNDLAAELYAHALISPRAPGLSGVHQAAPARNPPGPTAPALVATVRGTLTASDDAAKRRLNANLTKNMPAYIEPKQFADALLDVLSLAPAAGAVPTIAMLQQAVNDRVPASSNPQINQFLNGVILRTGGDLRAIRNELASWFDNAMDRLSGAYKQYTQLIAFLAALVISVAVNADTLQMAQRVWAQPALVASLKVGTTAQDTSASYWQIAKSLPLGWADHGFFSVWDQNGKTVTLTGGPLVQAILGWLITALASLFGAPFWFDALQRVTRLKGTGPSPDEKADKTAAAA
ncbi:MAG TPA: hypothetical protein VMI52_05115 [Acetobacteraceae bacterium]|nr:hypothetical protein [Acetobacteraceae bacterium]